MEQTYIARFTVNVTSTDNASWQGTVEADGESITFRSEMELLRFLLARYPSLRPDTTT